MMAASHDTLEQQFCFSSLFFLFLPLPVNHQRLGISRWKWLAVKMNADGHPVVSFKYISYQILQSNSHGYIIYQSYVWFSNLSSVLENFKLYMYA